MLFLEFLVLETLGNSDLFEWKLFDLKIAENVLSFALDLESVTEISQFLWYLLEEGFLISKSGEKLFHFKNTKQNAFESGFDAVFRISDVKNPRKLKSVWL